MEKSWIAHAIPNNKKQALVQTRVRVQIDAPTPITPGHRLAHAVSKMPGMTKIQVFTYDMLEVVLQNVIVL